MIAITGRLKAVITTDLTPPRPNRQTKRSFLILCEDDDQAAYLEWLKSAFVHPLLTIRQLPERLLPGEAAAHAATLHKAEKSKGTHFDEVWCLLTVPTKQSLIDALELQKSSKILLAATVGTFTAWLELHWEDGATLPATLIEETSPAGFAAALQDRVEVALRRAAADPSITTVDRLVRALDASGRTFSQRGAGDI